MPVLPSQLAAVRCRGAAPAVRPPQRRAAARSGERRLRERAGCARHFRGARAGIDCPLPRAEKVRRGATARVVRRVRACLSVRMSRFLQRSPPVFTPFAGAFLCELFAPRGSATGARREALADDKKPQAIAG